MFSTWRNWFTLCWMSNHWYCIACSTSTPRPLSIVASEATSVCVWSIWEISSVALAARLPMGTNTKIQINSFTLKRIGCILMLSNVHILWNGHAQGQQTWMWSKISRALCACTLSSHPPRKISGSAPGWWSLSLGACARVTVVVVCICLSPR